MDRRKLKQKVDNKVALTQKEQQYTEKLKEENYMDYSEMAKRIHLNNRDKGFWDDDQGDLKEKVVLIISELMEGLEADREDRHASKESFYMSQEIEEFGGFKERFETYIKDTFEDELADVAIRLLDLIYYLDSNTFHYNFNLLCKPVNEYIVIDRNKFSTDCYDMIRHLTHGFMNDDVVYFRLLSFFYFFMEYAESEDIHWHVEQKVKYNETRKHKHGKAY